jgi:hypothetical protein
VAVEIKKNTMNTNGSNVLGAILSVFILFVCCLIFIFRLGNQLTTEYWLGIVLLFTALPLIYLLFKAEQFQRPYLYYIQIGLMITFLIVELLLDYIFRIQFRDTNWIAIIYVMLFFAGTGGMIGIASHAGKIWTIVAVLLFFNMTALAFYQRAVTGM